MKYKIKGNLVWEKINEKIIILDSEGGKYFELNESASKVWNLLKRFLSEKELIDKISKEYIGNEKEIIKKDIKEILKNLNRKGILIKES